MRENKESGESLAKRCESNVLILGGTGTGKTTLAERIHFEGTRAKGPWVNVNLASLHEATIESTLFGHERGAFTGADRPRIGRLESANGGTLFFDEIGELSLPIQARLLEFLQSRSITPIGSNRSRKVDVRIVCATNRDLEWEIRKGRFREDLFHRIRVLTIKLESLSEVSEEKFAEAVHDAIERVSRKTARPILRLSKDVAELFECYSWPGNFRELESVLEVSALSCVDGVLEAEDLPRWFLEKAKAGAEYLMDVEIEMRSPRDSTRGFLASAEVPVGRNFSQTMEKFESAVLRFYIERSRGCLAKAAREAGVPKATFYRKAQSYGLLARG